MKNEYKLKETLRLLTYLNTSILYLFSILNS